MPLGAENDGLGGGIAPAGGGAKSAPWYVDCCAGY